MPKETGWSPKEKRLGWWRPREVWGPTRLSHSRGRCHSAAKVSASRTDWITRPKGEGLGLDVDWRLKVFCPAFLQKSGRGPGAEPWPRAAARGMPLVLTKRRRGWRGDPRRGSPSAGGLSRPQLLRAGGRICCFTNRHGRGYNIRAMIEHTSHKVWHQNRVRQTRSLTEGNPYSLIIRFALPIFLSQVFQQLYNAADSVIVGQFLGTDALAAVSSSGTLIYLMVSFFNGTALGAGVVISHCFGARDEDGVSRAIHTDLAFGICSGLVLTVAGVLLTPTFLVWMGTDAEVLPQAIEYFRYYFLGVISVVLYNICTGIMNAVGDSRRPLFYLIFSSLTNVALDLLFIGVFHWGVWSAAVATTLAQTMSCVLCFVHLAKKGSVYSVSLRKIRFHGDMLRRILRYGMPAGIQNSVIGLANVIVQTQINSFAKLAMAAYGSQSKIEGFAFMPITSFSMAITTFISQNLGAQKYDRARKGARFGIISAVVLAELIGVLYYIFAPALIGIFDDNPGVIAYGVQQARTAALFYFLLAFSHSVAAVCRGSGKAFVPMLIMFSVWCVLRVAYIAVVMHLFGEIGYIYWAYPITWAISSVIYLFYFLFSDWIHGFDPKVPKAKKA